MKRCRSDPDMTQISCSHRDSLGTVGEGEREGGEGGEREREREGRERERGREGGRNRVVNRERGGMEGKVLGVCTAAVTTTQKTSS